MKPLPCTSIIVQYVAWSGLLAAPVVVILLGGVSWPWLGGFMAWWLIVATVATWWHRNFYPNQDVRRISQVVERAALCLLVLLPALALVVQRINFVLFGVAAGWYLIWSLAAALWSRNVHLERR